MAFKDIFFIPLKRPGKWSWEVAFEVTLMLTEENASSSSWQAVRDCSIYRLHSMAAAQGIKASSVSLCFRSPRAPILNFFFNMQSFDCVTWFRQNFLKGFWIPCNLNEIYMEKDVYWSYSSIAVEVKFNPFTIYHWWRLWWHFPIHITVLQINRGKEC